MALLEATRTAFTRVSCSSEEHREESLHMRLTVVMVTGEGGGKASGDGIIMNKISKSMYIRKPTCLIRNEL